MTNAERAQEIFEQTRPNPRHIEMGFPTTPIQNATVDEIQAHLDLVDEIAQETGARLDASKIEFGTTREQIVEIAEKKARAYRRGAGARALKAKYGKDAAERIIAQKTGKHVNLK